MAAATATRRTRFTGPPNAVPAGPTCRVADWPCFAPGTHKGRLYTAADLDRIAANFDRLSAGDAPAIKVKAKLGHDDAQRLARSLGLPNAGTVTRCRVAGPGQTDPRGRPIGPGTLVLDVDGVPPDVGARINAGQINDGSVELLDAFPDPDDPGQMIPGPVLQAVSFLGEEQPAVKGLLAPVATFAAGHPRVTRVVFSEVTPVRDELLQELQAAGLEVSDPALAALTDDQLRALRDQLCGDAFAAAMKKRLAIGGGAADRGAMEHYAPRPKGEDGGTIGYERPKDRPHSDRPHSDRPHSDRPHSDRPHSDAAGVGPDDETPPAWFRSYAADCTRRMGAMEQSMQDMQKAKPDLQAAAAFAKDYQSILAGEKKRLVEECVSQAVREGRLIPHAKGERAKQLMLVEHTPKSVFAAGSVNAGRTPFEVALADTLAAPVSGYFAAHADPVPAGPANPTDDPFYHRALSHTRGGRQVLSDWAAARTNEG